MPTLCLIGCGRWGRLILRDLVSLGARVYVVAPGEESRQAGLAGGAIGSFRSVADVPEPIDGFIVASQTATHAEVVEGLLRFERPIFVEKPMTPDVEAARRLVKLAGDRIFVMDKWRYHRGVEALRDTARSGRLGRVLSIRTSRLGWRNLHGDVDAVWILLPHDFAIIYEILGVLPPVAMAFSSVQGGADSDLIVALGETPNNIVAVAEISAFHPISRRAVNVIGSEASAELGDSYDDRIVFAAKGAEPIAIPIDSAMPLLSELNAFLGYLRGGLPPRSTAAEGLMVVERIAEARRLAGLPA